MVSAGCWANSFSFIRAANASEPMPNPAPPKKWRRVISSTLPSSCIGLLLRKRFIQIQQDVGDHGPGCAVFGPGSLTGDLSRLVRMGCEVLASLPQPAQDAVRLVGLRKAAGH